MKKIGLLAVLAIAIAVGSAFTAKVSNKKASTTFEIRADQLSPRDPITKSINQGYVNTNYVFFQSKALVQFTPAELAVITAAHCAAPNTVICYAEIEKKDGSVVNPTAAPVLVQAGTWF